MSKPFENIPDDSFHVLELILENPGASASDLFFDEPTIDGQIDILQREKLVQCCISGEIEVTELGRAALKYYDQFKLKESESNMKYDEQLKSFKQIADNTKQQVQVAVEQAVSADKDARFAKITSIIAILISIAAIVVPLLYSK